MVRTRTVLRLLLLAIAGIFAAAVPATAQQSATPPESAARASAPYLVNPGDDLDINVWGDERLQRSARVLPDGTIAFPLVGQLRVQGRALPDIEKMISAGLASEYRGPVPQVTVSVKAASGMQFSVMGRVKSPGSYSPGRYINVLEALSMAGGPSEFANLDNVLLIRKSGRSLATTKLRLSGVFRSGASGTVDQTNVPEIQSGDTVIVP